MLLAILIAMSSAGTAFAETSSSTHYQVSETEFGAGSTEKQCSAQYCTQASIGDISGGKSSGTSTKATFGSVTPDVPSLDVIVDTGVTDLGVLTTERTATKESVIKIRTYLSSGYTLQITGDPPKYGNHMLATPSTPATSQMGKEQFGINLVANTTPAVGAAPVQVPSNQTSFGYVASGYDSANHFKYSSGDVVGRSDEETGQTEFTVSFVINIANNTPAGKYHGDYSAVVIPVY